MRSHARVAVALLAALCAAPCCALAPGAGLSCARPRALLRAGRLAARDDGPAKSSFEIEAAELRKKAAELSSGAKDAMGKLQSGDAGRDALDSMRSLADKARNGELASEALSAIERAAQEAAGQSEEEVAAAKGLRAPGVATPLPDSFEDAVDTAVRTSAQALEDGVSRLVIEFDTSAGDETYTLLSRTLKVVQPFLPAFVGAAKVAAADAAEGEPQPPTVQLLFPDEGTAAFVKEKWELPPNTICTSMGRAQLQVGAGALVLVAPGATEVEAVQRLMRQAAELAPTMPLIMFNPKLVDMQSTGYGLVGRDLRNQVANSFDTVFCLKTLLGGAVNRAYPADFSVWREQEGAEGGYVCAYAGAQRPSGDELDELLQPPEAEGGDSGSGGGMMDGFAKFVKGFQAL